MAESFAGVRLNALRRSQNADGGWGYFPGKQSWLEPTVYAALALQGDPGADRAWALLKSWQLEDGSLRPAAGVAVPSWGAALFVTLGMARKESGEPVKKAVEWLLSSEGAESRWISRALARVGLFQPERDLSLKGWPWKPETSSWVEPTAHSLVALKKVAHSYPSADLDERIRLGHLQLMDVRSRDGGWNYGSREALKVDLPSYPETTGIALVGLQGQPGLGKALTLASRWLGESISPLARVWLEIAMRLRGLEVATRPDAPVPADLQIVALEALAAPEGNHHLFRTEAS